MSHGDTIDHLPENFDVIASTSSVRVAAYKMKQHNGVTAYSFILK
jgi:GMP synthase (glutamine-hydrolysing)